MTRTYTVRLVIPTGPMNGPAIDRLHQSGHELEGWGSDRAIAVLDIDASSDIDALVAAREALRNAGGPDPLWIASVRPTTRS